MTRRPAPFQWARLVPYLLVTLVCVALAVAVVNADGATSRQTVTFRLHKTESVLRFFHNRPWMVARRAEKCWEVAWQPTCRIARGLVRVHSKRKSKLLQVLEFHLPVSGDWVTSVRIVQRVYPGTASWLLSCSAVEGGHGRWVRYGGGSYYPGYEHTDAVGGQMQFRPSTYYGAARRSYDYLTAKGFRVPRHEVTGLEGWLSPMGQALAAGYLRAVDGSSRWHWAASISNGCS